MTNKQKIAALEKELRRYEKKVGDLQKINAKLAGEVAAARAGIAQYGSAVDAVLAQTALYYGEAATDPDTGKRIGWRLELPLFKAAALLRKYEVHARRDDKRQTYIVGVGLRDDPDDHKSDAQRAEEAAE